jgi:hypothetical protein
MIPGGGSIGSVVSDYWLLAIGYWWLAAGRLIAW